MRCFARTAGQHSDVICGGERTLQFMGHRMSEICVYSPSSVTPQHCAKKDSQLVFCRMREFLEFVIRQLVEFPDDMVLTEIPSGRTTIFKLQLRRGDVGRVIGRGGQTIQAIRALLASSAARHGQRAVLEIIE